MPTLFGYVAQYLAALKAKNFSDEDAPDEMADPDAVEEPTVVPDPQEPKRMRVGAWAGWGSMATDKDVARDINFMRSTGLDRIDIVCNDHAADRSPRAFGTYSPKRVVALAQAARGAGLQVHLMTWCMPHEDYLRGLGRQMMDLADSCGASSIQLDAEEPWTQAKKPMAYEEAAELVDEVISAPWGVTGIGYTPANKVGPLVRRAAYMVPQCYATTSSGLNPATVAPRLSARWRQNFGDRVLVVGLAGYRQSNIPGYTTESAVRAAFKGASEVGARDVVYWSLRHLRTNKTISKTIASLIAAQR